LIKLIFIFTLLRDKSLSLRELSSVVRDIAQYNEGQIRTSDIPLIYLTINFFFE